MTPQQALQIIDQATGLAPLNRQAHIQVQEALKVLAEFIQEKTTSPEPDKNTPEEVL